MRSFAHERALRGKRHTLVDKWHKWRMDVTLRELLCGFGSILRVGIQFAPPSQQ